MKITFLLLSFLLFGLSTYPLFGAAEDVLDPVVDITGEDLQTDVLYYVFPYIWPLGGGLGLGRNWNGTFCPYSVIQSPFEVNDGFSVRFSPILVQSAFEVNDDSVIRVSTDIDISFIVAPKLCYDSPIWKISDSFVTLGGVGGSFIDRFRIVEHNVFPSLKTYKIVFCKARRACQNIGIFNKNGIRYLALSEEPYVVVFSQTTKVTDGHKMY